MRERLQEFGWQQIEVIDEDLGRSASGTAARNGFERMVAYVWLGKVGAVAAREVSRFARNSAEWQQLVEVCRLVDTLLIDLDVVYAPRLSNDRLLLGLKGSLNEYELDLLRQRSLEVRYEKARRGELLVAAPVGYLKTDGQRLEMDPDRRVQERIRLIFQKFMELGSIRQTLLWFLQEDLQVPGRQEDGTLVWKRPGHAPAPPGLPVLFVVSSCRHAVVTAPVEPSGILSLGPPPRQGQEAHSLRAAAFAVS